MIQPEPYARLTRAKALALLMPTGTDHAFSGGDLLIQEDIGVLFVAVGNPPIHSYFRTPRTLRWFSSETDTSFYNQTMLSFRSQYQPDQRPLYLFAKSPNEEDFSHIGVLRVLRANCPNPHIKSPEFPATVVVEFEVCPKLPPQVWRQFDWSNHNLCINGLLLPITLAAAITSGRSRIYAEPGGLLAPDEMERTTKAMIEESKWCPQNYARSSELGRSIEGHEVLDLDKAICIGYFGFPDEPLCLDYRASETQPRVVYLTGEGRGFWKEVAPNCDEFVGRLRPC